MSPFGQFLQGHAFVACHRVRPPLSHVEEVMAHDGQNPSPQTGPISEEATKAQRSLAGVLHQVESLLPIASELVGVTTKNRELGHQIGLKVHSTLQF